MPAIEYATKYSQKVDERFTKGSLTDALVNNDYDWIGVETVNVYSIPTVGLNDYSLTGASRYGTPAELENKVQEMTVSQDKSFTFTIDRKSYDDTMMTMQAGAALARQIDEVIIPEVDIYRLTVMAAKAGNVVNGTAGYSNAYEEFLKVQEELDNDLVPMGGRVCVGTSGFINKIKLDGSFTSATGIELNKIANGQVGEIDNVPLIKVPAKYMPTNTDFIITNRIATVAPIKLQSYRIHQDPPGINGWLIEGRIRFDAFVLDNKVNAIGIHKTA